MDVKQETYGFPHPSLLITVYLTPPIVISNKKGRVRETVGFLLYLTLPINISPVRLYSTYNSSASSSLRTIIVVVGSSCFFFL